MNDFLLELRNANSIRSLEWCGVPTTATDTNELLFRTTELGGEVGEALNVAKKLARYANGWVGGLNPTEARDKIREELADVIICVDRVAEWFEIDLRSAVKEKFNATSDKYNLKAKL